MGFDRAIEATVEAENFFARTHVHAHFKVYNCILQEMCSYVRRPLIR